jgi:hypothetical protein
MSHSHRSLTLTIDAESEEDMAALLRQALYELNKHLPPPSDAPIEERLRCKAILLSNIAR